MSRRDPQAAGDALRAGVAADQRADAGAVERRDAAEIDDQIAIAATEQLLEVPLERLGGAAADDRLLRRQHESIADPFRTSFHSDGGEAIYIGLPDCRMAELKAAERQRPAGRELDYV